MRTALLLCTSATAAFVPIHGSVVYPATSNVHRSGPASASAVPLQMALISSLAPSYPLAVDWPLAEPSVPITGSSAFAFVMLAAIFVLVADPAFVASASDPYAWRHVNQQSALRSQTAPGSLHACVIVPTPASVVEQKGGSDDRDWWVCPPGAMLVNGKATQVPECVEVFMDGEYVLACAF